MTKIDLNKIKYLAFEGGGGKGLIYLGAIRALEEQLAKLGNSKSKRPIIDLKVPLNKRKIKGISGASAGAITSFMLSIGMSARDIENEVNTTKYEKFDSGKMEVSQFELFFDKPNPKFMKAVLNHGGKKEYDNHYKILIITIKAFFNSLGIVFKAVNFLKNLFVRQSKSVPLKRFFNNSTDSSDYMYSALFNRGVFTGFTTREYFATLIDNYLYKQIDFNELLKPYLPQRIVSNGTATNTTPIVLPENHILRKIIINFDSMLANTEFRKTPVPKDAKDLTFFEFYYLTKVDLVITGTNVSKGRSLYLSVYHTPDFPVIDAVSISMNLPIIFKPIYVNYTVHKQKDLKYNDLYKGLWVDGGMLNNFPIHAFDELERITDGKDYFFDIAKTKANTLKPFSNIVLGFRIKGKPEEKDTEFNEDLMVITSYVGSLINTFMYSGGDGQIRTPQEEASTIYLNSFVENKINKDGKYENGEKYSEISVIDFASAGLDMIRGNSHMAKIKQSLIIKAHDNTYARIS